MLAVRPGVGGRLAAVKERLTWNAIFSREGAGAAARGITGREGATCLLPVASEATPGATGGLG